MNELIYLLFFAGIVLSIGIRERKNMYRNIRRIPNRILVNGIRGKSTVTRLVMGILKEDNQRVAGKTTGTSPRLFYWDKENEEPIVRSLQGANISEQKFITRQVARRSVDAFVTECMAVNPDYQATFQDQFVQSGITIITNVVEDHLDVMGPTLDQVAEAFAKTIPHNGHLILSPTEYEDYFRQIADKQNTEVYMADPEAIDEDYLKQFPYMMFPENAAIGLALAEVLGIDEQIALKGMLNAPVDPGAMRVHTLGDVSQPSFFYNGFAANDASSTISIWDKIQELHPDTPHQAVVMNCREDRMDRTIQFAEEVLPRLQTGTLILTGRGVSPVVDAYQRGTIQAENMINMEKQPADKVVNTLQDLPNNSVIFGIGNIHGGGEELASAIEQIHTEDESDRSHLPSRMRDRQSTKEKRFELEASKSS